MNKVYTRINWENYPSENTAVNEINLNKMDYAIDELDTRVVQHETTKANVASLNELINYWHIDETTGVITIHKVSGEQIIFDLNIEKVPVGFSMTDDGILIMTTDDGAEFTANIGSMIPVLTFQDTDEIAVSVTGEGVNKTYSFAIKTGSIKEDKLQPNFLADCRLSESNAQLSANSSKYYSEEAKKYADEAKGSAELANTDGIVDIMNQATTTWEMPDYMKNRDENPYVCGIGTPEENGYSADDYNDENGYGEPYLDVRSGMVYHAIRVKDLPLTYGWVEKEQLKNIQDSAGGSGLTEITYAEYSANKASYDASGKAYAIPDYPYSAVSNAWTKLYGATISNTTFPIAIPDDCTEVYVQLLDGSSSYAGDFTLLKRQCFHQPQTHVNGWYYSATDCGSFRVQTNTTGITGAGITKGGQKVADTSVWLTIYYK